MRHVTLSLAVFLASGVFAGSAFAAATPALGGGGATLPARAYSGSSATADATGPRFSVPAPGSLFAEGSPNADLSYCQTGSGAGRAVLTSASGNNDDRRACPANFTITTFLNGTDGFGSPRADADFAGSDAPAGATDFTNFRTNEGAEHTQLVQFPTVVGNVAVVYNNADIRQSINLLLTEAELCNIWTGRINNWSQLVNKFGVPFAAKPIKLVYRGDSSGTSFGFSNHLNWVCADGSLNQDLVDTAAPLPFAAADNFSVQTTFATAFPTNTGVPAGSLTGSGNPGVISVVNSTDGAIGYAEVANLLATGSTSPRVRVANIAAFDTNELDPKAPNTPRAYRKYQDPAANAAVFKLPVKYVDKDGATYSSSYTDRALQANNATFGRPVGLGTALTADQVPVANCVFLVQPGAYATSPYSTAGDPSTGYKFYPIGVVTYLLSNQSGNPNFRVLRSLMGAAYNVDIRGSVTSVGANTGYSYLGGVAATPLVGKQAQKLSQPKINSCVTQ